MTEFSSGTADTETPRKKHTARTRLAFAAAAVGVTLFVLLFAAWASINAGVFNDSITQRMIKRFGAPVKIGGINASALLNLNLQKIEIGAPGSTNPVTIDSIHVDVGIIDAVFGGRMRSVTVDQPNVSLNYDAAGGWTPFMTMTSEPGESGKLDALTINNGSVLFDWKNRGRFALSKINASLTTDRSTLAHPFFATGEFESTRTIRAKGILSPGGGLDAHVVAEMDLARDGAIVASFVPGLSGLVQCDLNLKRAAQSPGRTTPPLVALEGSVQLQRVVVSPSVLKGRSLSFGDERFHVASSGIGYTNNGDSLDISGLTVASETLGTVAADVSMCQKSHCVQISNASGEIRLESLTSFLTPNIFGEESALHGTVSFSNIKSSFSTDKAGPGPGIDGPISVKDAWLETKSLGAFPKCQFKADFKTGGFENATLSFGDCGTFVFEMFDMRDVIRNPFSDQAVTIHSVHFDFGKFFDSDLGKRVLALEAQAGTRLPRDNPMSGTVSGKNLQIEPVASTTKPGTTILNIDGLTLNSLVFKQKLMGIPLPEFAFSGPLHIEIASEKNVAKSIIAKAVLKGESPKGSSALDLATQLLGKVVPTFSTTIQATFICDENGAWKMTALEADGISIPLKLTQ
ncbi:MAG: hypothetical protein WCT04_17045 [Planctomycetota bacterium]